MLRFKSTVSAVAIVLIVAFLLCACSGNESGDSQDSSSTEAVTAVASPDESGAVAAQIPGFNANSAENGKTKDSNGITLPYIIPDTQLTVTAMGGYSGEYVEDGADEPVSGVFGIVVRNNYDRPVQYAEITMTVSDDTTLSFKLSTIPKGCSVLVLESSKTLYTSQTQLKSLSAKVTNNGGFSLSRDKVSVTFDGKYLVLNNLTDTDFKAVYVRYKNYVSGNVYLGGITYSASFDTVVAKKQYTYQPAHFFADSSEILMVEVVE